MSNNIQTLAEIVIEQAEIIDAHGIAVILECTDENEAVSVAAATLKAELGRGLFYLLLNIHYETNEGTRPLAESVKQLFAGIKGGTIDLGGAE